MRHAQDAGQDEAHVGGLVDVVLDPGPAGRAAAGQREGGERDDVAAARQLLRTAGRPGRWPRSRARTPRAGSACPCWSQRRRAVDGPGPPGPLGGIEQHRRQRARGRAGVGAVGRRRAARVHEGVGALADGVGAGGGGRRDRRQQGQAGDQEQRRGPGAKVAGHPRDHRRPPRRARQPAGPAVAQAHGRGLGQLLSGRGRGRGRGRLAQAPHRDRLGGRLEHGPRPASRAAASASPAAPPPPERQVGQVVPRLGDEDRVRGGHVEQHEAQRPQLGRAPAPDRQAGRQPTARRRAPAPGAAPGSTPAGCGYCHGVLEPQPLRLAHRHPGEGGRIPERVAAKGSRAPPRAAPTRGPAPAAAAATASMTRSCGMRGRAPRRAAGGRPLRRARPRVL